MNIATRLLAGLLCLITLTTQAGATLIASAGYNGDVFHAKHLNPDLLVATAPEDDYNALSLINTDLELAERKVINFSYFPGREPSYFVVEQRISDNEIAIGRDGGIIIVNIDTEEETFVSLGSVVYFPRELSPDGTKLLIESFDPARWQGSSNNKALVLDVESLEVVAEYTTPTRVEFHNLEWLNDEVVVYIAEDIFGTLDFIDGQLVPRAEVPTHGHIPSSPSTRFHSLAMFEGKILLSNFDTGLEVYNADLELLDELFPEIEFFRIVSNGTIVSAQMKSNKQAVIARNNAGEMEIIAEIGEEVPTLFRLRDDNSRVTFPPGRPYELVLNWRNDTLAGPSHFEHYLIEIPEQMRITFAEGTVELLLLNPRDNTHYFFETSESVGEGSNWRPLQGKISFEDGMVRQSASTDKAQRFFRWRRG